MNKIVYKNNGLEFDVQLETTEVKDIIKILDKLMTPIKEEHHECKCNHNKEVTPIAAKNKQHMIADPRPQHKIAEPPKVMKPAPTNTRKSNYPPIWIVECPDCGDFVCLNVSKLDDKVFNCAKCGCKVQLSEDHLVLAQYKCECGTMHSVAVHSLSTIVSTKCRACAMPIDLKWNEKKERYEKL